MKGFYSVMTAEKPKRSWMPFWLLPDPTKAYCGQCGRPMVCSSTRELDGGLVIQKRRCNHCGAQGQTSYRRESD